MHSLTCWTLATHSDLSHALSLLQTQQQCSVSRLVRSQDRMNSIAGRLMARYFIFMHTHIPNHHICIQYTPNFRKPFFPDIPFNISHHQQCVIFVASLTPALVGCDVVALLPMGDSLMLLVEECCTFEEQNLIRTKHQSLTSQTAQFYLFWTLKEAYVKAVGEGLHIPLNTLDFSCAMLHDGKIEWSGEARRNGEPLFGWKFRSALFEDNRYIASIAILGDVIVPKHVRFEPVDIDCIIEELKSSQLV